MSKLCIAISDFAYFNRYVYFEVLFIVAAIVYLVLLGLFNMELDSIFDTSSIDYSKALAILNYQDGLGYRYLSGGIALIVVSLILVGVSCWTAFKKGPSSSDPVTSLLACGLTIMVNCFLISLTISLLHAPIIVSVMIVAFGAAGFVCTRH